MKPLLIFLKAIGFYLLFTLPTIAVPVMYALSAFYAFTFGWIAFALFTIVYYSLLQSNITFQTKWCFLCLAVVLGVAIAHHTIGLLVYDMKVWDLNLFLCFPGAAILAGWVSLYSSRRSIKEIFDPEEDELNQLLEQQ